MAAYLDKLIPGTECICLISYCFSPRDTTWIRRAGFHLYPRLRTYPTVRFLRPALPFEGARRLALIERMPDSMDAPTLWQRAPKRWNYYPILHHEFDPSTEHQVPLPENQTIIEPRTLIPFSPNYLPLKLLAALKPERWRHLTEETLTNQGRNGCNKNVTEENILTS